METEAGIELNEKEEELIKDLKKLAKKWQKNSKDLWLFSASGTLCVMLRGDTQRNPIPEKVKGGASNTDNVICSIEIPNDGGDW